MKIQFFPKETRGTADHGWLQANFSFSFANFYDANREQFGQLRVLNDDIIAPSKGFGMHPHRNMEIISIPLSGELAHQDSLDHKSIIKTGEIQVMSAGSGILHSEFNPSKTELTNLLQIWVLPNKVNVEPRYDQKYFSAIAEENQFVTVVAPKNTIKGALWIHQDAYFNLATISEGKVLKYKLRNTKNGVYAFVISGSVTIEGQNLKSKDALTITEISEINMCSVPQTRILLIEVPL